MKIVTKFYCYGNVEHKLYGIHWIASYSECKKKSSNGKYVIDDLKELTEIISKGLVDIGAHIFSTSGKQFEPQGVSVLIGITESHASAHSWPEDNFMEFDFNTCNLKMNGEKLLKYLAKKIGAKKLHFSKVLRYTNSDEVVESKSLKL